MGWEMTVMLFCAVGIVWMAIAMPYSRGWRYLNVRMEDSLSRSTALLQEHHESPDGDTVQGPLAPVTEPAAR